MSFLYCFAGISHFWKPKIFLSITPKWVPFPKIVNIIVGIIEIILGVLVLFEATRSLASLGIIVLLIAVFPANVYHFQKAKRKGKLVIPTIIRLPMQLLLIYWAYTFF
jgi:uncharacterized membrane protein